MGLLDGRVAFVTGGASGIGRSVALRFAEEGADVVLADLQDDEGEAARQEVEARGRGAAFVRCDVSSWEDVERAVGTAIDRFGRLDIVFANAGVNGVWAPIEDLTPEEWDSTLDINLKGTFLTVRAAVPHLRSAGGGSIIVTSSVNGTRTFSNPGASAYSASKAGQVAFARMAALELGRHGIRVNSVLPGFIHTNIEQRTQKRNTDEIEIAMELPEGIPAIDGGVGEPAEVADTCLFLASDLSRHVSGVEIYVDGGASLLR
jgi:NAD(P)-dependent dehydrogenase (short-subunit alcohol dehydrogenase family)